MEQVAQRGLPTLPARGFHRFLLPFAGFVALLPWVSSGAALLLGVTLALTIGNPWPQHTRALAHRTLTWSVVGLGAGMNLAIVGRVGLHGLVLYRARH